MDKIIEKIKKRNDISEIKETERYITIFTTIAINLVYEKDLPFKDRKKHYISFKIKKVQWRLSISSLEFILPSIKDDVIEVTVKHKYRLLFIYDNTLESAVKRIEQYLDKFNSNLEKYI